MNLQNQSLYEDEGFQAFSGGTLRPGGLELTAEALAAAHIPPGTAVLDVGCGLGETVAFLAGQGYCAAGLDASDNLLEKARQNHPGLDFRFGQAGALPWEDGFFYGVFCECSFSLFPNQTAVLGEIHRVLVAGGRLILVDFYLLANQVEVALPGGTCLQGAQGRQSLAALLESQRFAPVIWQDARAHLRQFTARMVWEYGSAEAFWGSVLPHCAKNAGGVSLPKLGYAFSIWERV